MKKKIELIDYPYKAFWINKAGKYIHLVAPGYVDGKLDREGYYKLMCLSAKKIKNGILFI